MVTWIGRATRSNALLGGPSTVSIWHITVLAPLQLFKKGSVSEQNDYGEVADLLSNVDGFFSADPIEALQAVKALVDAYGGLIRDRPQALIQLLQSDAGKVLLMSSAATVSSSLTRTISDLSNRS